MTFKTVNSNISVWCLVAVVLLSVCKHVVCLHCLSCKDVPYAHDCTYLMECGPHEVCYASQVVSATGHIFRVMGCRPSHQCPSGIIGKREDNQTYDVIHDDTLDKQMRVADVKQKRDATDIAVCDGCCNSQWCQAELCQDVAIKPKPDRGPICYIGGKQLDGVASYIRHCERDEVCYGTLGHATSTTGCANAQNCSRIHSSVNGCWTCCADDLCNAACNSTHLATTTRKPTASTTSCTDLTPAEGCRLAASIVCATVEKARNSNLWYLLTIVLFSVCKHVTCLHCLSCQDVPSAQDCTNIKECGPHEVCYAWQGVSASGHIIRSMGCRDRLQCTSGIVVGKREVNSNDDVIMDDTLDMRMRNVQNKRNATDLMVCDECCDSLWCQANLCQDMAFRNDRGPICFECQDQTAGDSCSHIRECGRDEVCYKSYQLSSSGNLLRRSGCYSSNACAMVQASVLHQSSTCWNCCADDLCNSVCGSGTPMSRNLTITTRKPAVTMATCKDTTPVSTCTLASSIVCADVEKARNSGCMKYCGYC